MFQASKKNSCRSLRYRRSKSNGRVKTSLMTWEQNSLDTVELIMAFEEEFGSEISDSEAEKILTVGDAVKFIEGKAN